MEIAVSYARYSSDLQKDRSIGDQEQLCDTIAARHRLKISQRFSDRAKTGATMFERDGLLALMTAAKQRKFKYVICEMLSRLSRDQEDNAAIFKRLTFYGIKIIDQNGEVTPIHSSIGGIVNSEFLKNLAASVKRGQSGLVREGLFPNKVAYGYRAVPFKPGVREIDPEKAEVVRRIFEEYADGRSPRSIADGLTADGIPSPAGNAVWNHNKIVGSSGNGIIRNQLYVGKIVWNIVRHVKDPETGKRQTRMQEPENRIERDVPHLRIVPQALWNRAHAIRTERSMTRFGAAGLVRTNRHAGIKEHILAGLLSCGACGAHMICNSANHDGSQRVICSASIRASGCGHKKSYSLGMLQETILDGVKTHLTSRKALAEYTRSYHARWAERQRESRVDREGTQKKLSAITVRIDRIISAISDSDEPVKALMDKLKVLEAERVGLQQRLELFEAEGNVVDLHPASIDTFCSNMDEMYSALTSSRLTTVQLAPFRAAFRNVFERIVVHPTGRREPYEVTPYARLSAIMGIELFPKMRTTTEMLAEQGVVVNAKAALSGSRCGHNLNRDVVSLGRWRRAA